MANSFGISARVEQRIRARDKRCVYCGVKFKKTPWRASATIEHFNNNGPFTKYYNIAICCRGCNSSKGVKQLLAWLDSAYCLKKGITKHTVANVVRGYLRKKRNGYERQPTIRLRNGI